MTDKKTESSAKAAADEAEQRGKREIVFHEGTDHEVLITLPRKWKRFKFLRALNRGDLGGALEAIWPQIKNDDGELEDHPVMSQLDELEIDDTEFEDALQRIAESLGGLSLGN